MLIDTHCHLGDPAFAPDRAEVVQRMRAAGVGRALVVESVIDRIDETMAWVATEAGLGLVTACHPHDATSWNTELAGRLRKAWAKGAVRAVGEIGLDYHYDFAPREVQRHAFHDQLTLAEEFGKPVVIHAREADDDVVAVLREHPGVVVILHSFSSGAGLRDAGLSSGWYFSFSGMVTFRNWTQQDAMRAVPDDRLLIETDSPYLAPVPYRGKRNEPAFVAEVARQLAAVRGRTFDEIAALTTGNAERLFWNTA